MIEKKECPECGHEIIFSYETPTRSFHIVGCVIVRDDAWVGPQYDKPSLIFHCSNDREHDIESEKITEWAEGVEKVFYHRILPTL